MAKKRKRKKHAKRHNLRGVKGGRTRKVLVKKSGTMTNMLGKIITWSKISPHAKFFHEK